MSERVAAGREVLVPLLVGHVAWSVHLLASYALATVGCAADPDALPVVRHGLTAVALLVTAWACWAVWPAVSRAGGAGGAAVSERRYAAWLTMALNVVFLLAILAAGAASALVQPCV